MGLDMVSQLSSWKILILQIGNKTFIEFLNSFFYTTIDFTFSRNFVQYDEIKSKD